MRAPTSGRPATWARASSCSERLAANRLDLVGGFVPVRFSEREHWDDDLAGLRAHARALRRPPGRRDARPVLCDAGGPERIANPGRGGEDLALDDRRWATLVDGVARAADVARAAGYEPVFHHHTSSYVEGLPEIERFLEDTEVDLLLDSGHLRRGRRRPDPGPAATGASGSASCTSRTRAWTCSRRSARSAPT